MKFVKTSLTDSYVIEIERKEDERGFFARTLDKKSFTDLNLDVDLFQNNISFNKKAKTLRGMHYQKFPNEEVKIVRCTKGKIFDVIIDLRPNSNSYKKWFGLELTSENHKMLYIPKGFAHGFLTLDDDSEIFYQMSDCFVPESALGIRWNDPSIGINWPFTPSIISDRDNSYPLIIP
jgi:dTDP-4-dehydrorhamnose 3,5-epimerase